jgi:acyl-CoA synthetase (AMP-forming)/AMP-acid ligase II
MIQMMLMDPACAKTDFSGFGPMIHGGSPMPQAVLDRSVKSIPCEHIQIYGLTETGAMATCLREAEHREKPERRASVGRPCPGVRVRILGPNQQELGPRQIGEICIYSPANMLGYWKREDATRATLVDGWIHTGDAGYLDEDGYEYICDRIKEMNIYAGENVYPAEVENALCGHPAVAEAAVFGVPDDRWGELVRAVVVLHPGAEATPSQIQQFVRGLLADFKVPQAITFAPALPRTASGKVQKGKLRAPFWEGRSRPICDAREPEEQAHVWSEHPRRRGPRAPLHPRAGRGSPGAEPPGDTADP